MTVLRRIWHFVIDLLDGILGGLLYGHEGGFLWTSTNTEAQNADKVRRWAAGGKKQRSEWPDERAPAPRSPHDDFDARMQRFRRETNTPKDQ